MNRQYTRRRSIKTHGPARSGLASLELVLWLPVLLLMVALMVNVGTMTVWRVRGEIVARDAAWTTRAADADRAARPLGPQWPTPARLEVQPDAPLGQLDDDALRHPVVRGPLGVVGVKPLLAPQRGAHRGVAAIERRFPLLAKLGSYRSGEIRHPLLGRVWQLIEMGLKSNLSRRTKALYSFPKTVGRLPHAYASAVRAVIAMPNFADLRVLDEDDELARYAGRAVDFHPRVGPMCELDPRVVRDREVVRLVGRDGRGGEIGRLPRTLAESFLAAYRAIDSMELQIKIQQLEAYLARLSQADGQ